MGTVLGVNINDLFGSTLDNGPLVIWESVVTGDSIQIGLRRRSRTLLHSPTRTGWTCSDAAPPQVGINHLNFQSPLPSQVAGFSFAQNHTGSL